jgi:predicted HicB family RNase H-like nuclease
MPELEVKPKKEATSIKIDPELWKEAKIEAIRRDVELGELVEESLRKELGRAAPPFGAKSKLKGGKL